MTHPTDIENFMRQAIQLASDAVAKNKGGPFGAIIVKDKQIIGRGQNIVTSSNDPTAHAEIQAIRDACKNLNTFMLNGCTMYSSCEPCPMCLSALYWARIEKIYYGATEMDAAAIGFDDAYIKTELNKNAEKRDIKPIQILRDEALVSFTEWQQKPDKIPY